jgi:mono/diheme cytochrome c family protein
MRVSSLKAVVLATLVGNSLSAQERPPPPAQVSPHQGPSWLRTLAISVDTTRLGHLGGEGPSAPASQALGGAIQRALAVAGIKDAEARKALDEPFAVDGEELYRLNCRACHGPRGEGAAPDVASLLGFAGALSPELLGKRMADAGNPIPIALATELSAQAERRLRERLREGGTHMPPFRHLSQPEITALLAYLQHLSGGPGSAAAGPFATETAARIGEQVVEGTCRICHDATGPSTGQRMIMSGMIPALQNLPEQLSLEAVVHKVHFGWKNIERVMHQGPSMPVFSYLTDEEIAAAYLYLAYYPPPKSSR